MFEVGKKYRYVTWALGSALCIGVNGKYGWFVKDNPNATPFTLIFSPDWIGVKEEKWVAMWWTDKFKTNINTSSQFFSSEKKVLDWFANVWDENSPSLFIKAVKVSED